MKKHGGTDFTLQCGKHFVTFRSAFDEADQTRVQLTLNGAKDFAFRASLHMVITASAVVLQEETNIPWPEPEEPRAGPPKLGSWVTTALGKELLTTQGVVRASTTAFARRVRVVGVLFFSTENELSTRFVKGLERCYLSGLMLDMGIVAVAVESSAEAARAARAGLPAEWAVLPHEQMGRVCERYAVRGLPSLVVLEALGGSVVRTNAVVDVLTHADEPATVLKLCGIEDPTCWAREQAKRRAASSRLSRQLELRPEDLLHAFRTADVDRSGSVSLGELMSAFRQLGLQVSHATAQLFRKHDVNHDNALDFVEFCVLCAQCRQLLQPREADRRQLLALFAEADSEQIGFLTLRSLVACLARAGVQTSADAISAITGRQLVDGSEFDFVEFAQLVAKLQPQPASETPVPPPTPPTQP